MENECPVTPPPELVKQWLAEPEYVSGWHGKCMMISVTDHRLSNICAKAAQWGADQELEACTEWLVKYGLGMASSEMLSAARRPKPPSLREQALLQLDTLNADLAMHGRGCDLSQIRRALEQLND